MKIYTTDENGNETVRTETRQEILARHNQMRKNHEEAMVYLESLHYGSHFDKIREENEKANQEDLEHQRDLGLVTEENTKSTCDDLAETMERIVELLKRHPHGYKNGINRTVDRVRGCNKGRAVKVEETEETEPEAETVWTDTVSADLVAA